MQTTLGTAARLAPTQGQPLKARPWHWLERYWPGPLLIAALLAAPGALAQSQGINLEEWGREAEARPEDRQEAPRSERWGQVEALPSPQETGAEAKSTPAPSSAKPRVAVLPFNVRGHLGIADAGVSIAEMMSDALASSGRYTLIERVLLQQLLEEQELQSSHLTDEATLAAEAGRLQGVEAIVSGTVIQWGDTITIVARMIDSSTGVIRATAEIKTRNRDSIPEQINLLARKLLGPEPATLSPKTGPSRPASQGLTAANPARLTISILPGPSFRLGQEMRFRVTSQQQGHLLVLDQNAAGEITQLYPLGGQEIGAADNLIGPGPGITLPSTSSGLRFTAGEPVGKSRLLAILSPEPIDLEDLLDQDASARSEGGADPAQSILERIAQMQGAANTSWSLTQAEYTIRP